jgi:hypothetical protein
MSRQLLILDSHQALMKSGFITILFDLVTFDT